MEDIRRFIQIMEAAQQGQLQEAPYWSQQVLIVHLDKIVDGVNRQIDMLKTLADRGDDEGMDTAYLDDARAHLIEAVRVLEDAQRDTDARFNPPEDY